MPENRKKLEVVVDRSRWRCGGTLDGPKVVSSHGDGATALLNGEGFQCCLGFAYEQLCETDLLNIKYITSPVAVHERHRKGFVVPHLVTSFGENSKLSKVAMKINDNSSLSREAREAALCAIFEMEDIRLTFEGDYLDD